MGVNSERTGMGGAEESLKPPLFRILREGERRGKLRTLEVQPFENSGVPAAGLPVPGDYRFFPGGKAGEIRKRFDGRPGEASVAVKGLPPLRRGLPRTAVPEAWAVDPVREILWIPLPGENEGDAADGRNLTAALRTAAGQELPLEGRVSLRRRRMFWQVIWDRAEYLIPGGEVLLQGGEGRGCRGRILWTGPSGPKDWAYWEECVARSGGLEGLSPRRIAALTALHRGWAPGLPGTEGLESAEGDSRSQAWAPGLLRRGGCWVEPRFWQTQRRKAERRARRSGGCAGTELAEELGLPGDLRESLLNEAEGEGLLIRKGEYLLPPREGRQESLSPAARKVLGDIRQAGDAGVSRQRLEKQGLGPVVDGLLRLGLAAEWVGFLVDAERWRELQKGVLGGRKPGDSLSLAEAKEETGLSRSRVIPLLEALEKEGRLSGEELGVRRVLDPGDDLDRKED